MSDQERDVQPKLKVLRHAEQRGMSRRLAAISASPGPASTDGNLNTLNAVNLQTRTFLIADSNHGGIILRLIKPLGGNAPQLCLASPPIFERRGVCTSPNDGRAAGTAMSMTFTIPLDWYVGGLWFERPCIHALYMSLTQGIQTTCT